MRYVCHFLLFAYNYLVIFLCCRYLCRCAFIVPDQKFLQEMLKESMFFENYPEVLHSFRYAKI